MKKLTPMDLADDIRSAANDLTNLVQSGQPVSERLCKELEEVRDQLFSVVAKVEEAE